MNTVEWNYKKVTDRWATVTAFIAVAGFYGTVGGLCANGEVPSLGSAGIIAAVTLGVVTVSRQKKLQQMVAGRVSAENAERQRQEQLRLQQVEQERLRLAREAAERQRVAAAQLAAQLAASRQNAVPTTTATSRQSVAPMSDDEMRQRAMAARYAENQAIGQYLRGQHGPLGGTPAAIDDWRGQEALDPMKRLGRAADPLGLRQPLGGPRIGPPPLGR